ncbi:MAG: protein kinase, partial [Actinomycetota bacterium]
MDPRIGTELAGYRIEELLGRGGMSVVYLATDLDLERKVALKILGPELAQERGFRDRFIRESRLAASLDHPNVVPVFEAGHAEDVLFISMRYVRGTDLRRVIEAEGRLEPHRVVEIVRQVASALDVAHRQGLVHRDVKPANVLIAARDDPDAPEHVYLSDFGVTKRRLSAGGLTATGQLVGTVDYVAPEQIKGEPIDGRADVYSLGCMTFQCLTGRTPFERDTEVAVLWAQVQTPPPSAVELRADLPAAVDGVLRRAMAKSPDERPQTAGAFARDLAPAARGVAGPEAPADRTRKPAPRPRRGIVAMAVALSVVLIAAGVTLALTRGGGGPAAVTTPGPTTTITGNLYRIDLRAARLVQGVTIPAGSHSSGGQGSVAVGQGFVWAASRTGLVKLNAQGTVLATIAGVPALFGTVAAGDEGVWVAAGQFRPDVLRVTHVDPTTNRIVGEMELPGGEVSGGAALVLSGTPVAVGEGTAWVADHPRSRVVRIDPRTNRVVARITVPA